MPDLDITVQETINFNEGHELRTGRIFYLDYVNGDDANDGSSWAQAWKTITGGPTAARIAPDDVIRIAKSPDPTSLSQTPEWANLTGVVTLDSPLTADIDMCESGWVTASATYCTVTHNSTYKFQGTYSVRLVTTASATSAMKLAYKTLSSTDFSAYKQISFGVFFGTTIPSDGLIQISLCSDTTGDTAVDTFNITSVAGLNTWMRLAIDKAAALGSAIQSIAIYITGSYASKTFYFDDFIACKDSTSADAITLVSLISKNSAAQGGDEGWYAIDYITGSTIQLANYHSYVGGYWSPNGTESVTTYKRETIKTAMGTISTSSIQAVQDSGTEGHLIDFQGGYDTDTTIQDGETFFDGGNSYGYGIYFAVRNYVKLNRLNTLRYYNGIYIIGSYNVVDQLQTTTACYTGLIVAGSYNTFNWIGNANNNYSGNIEISYNANIWRNTFTEIVNANNVYAYGLAASISYGTGGAFTNMGNVISELSYCCNNAGQGGIYFATGYGNEITHIGVMKDNPGTNALHFDSPCIGNKVGTIDDCSSNATGVRFDGSENIIKEITNCDDNTYGIYFTGNRNRVQKLNTSGSVTYAVYSTSSGGATGPFSSKNYIHHWTAAETTTKIGVEKVRVYSTCEDDDPDKNFVYTAGGRLQSQTTVRHTASGIAWQISPSSSFFGNPEFPLAFPLAQIACVASKLVTVKAWMRKDHATEITGKLVCRRGQLAGLTNDAVATKSDVADTWEELTITFTPTERGVVEIEAQAYGGTTRNLYVDDMTITQAD